MTLKAGAEQSAIWSTFEAEVAPGFDVGAHLHDQAEEVFYVLEGELDLLAFQPGAQAAELAHVGVADRGQGAARRAGQLHVRARRMPACLLQPAARAGPDALPRVPGRPRDLPPGAFQPAGRRGTTRPCRDRGAAAPPRHPPAHAAHEPPARDITPQRVPGQQSSPGARRCRGGPARARSGSPPASGPAPRDPRAPRPPGHRAAAAAAAPGADPTRHPAARGWPSRGRGAP